MRTERVATVLTVLSILLTVLAGVTLIPWAGASKPNILGYRSVCTFTPVSAVILLFVANFLNGIRKKKFK